MSRMDYLALPVIVGPVLDPTLPVSNDAWNAIKELLFDDDAKAFADFMKDAGVPAPESDDVGYEVVSEDEEVVATVEIAWPNSRIGFMTTDQAVDKEKLEALGWTILSLIDATDSNIANLFGGEN